MWRAPPANPFQYYESLLVTTPRVVFRRAVVAVVILIAFRGFAPRAFWSDDAKPVAMATESAQIGVRVAKGLQPVDGRYSLRITFGGVYALDPKGECRINSGDRGRHHDVLDSAGQVVKDGFVPDEGDLFVRLDK